MADTCFVISKRRNKRDRQAILSRTSGAELGWTEQLVTSLPGLSTCYLPSLNTPEAFSLALVEFLDSDTHRVHYVRRPFRREPDFGVTRVNYDCSERLARAREPS